MYRAPYTHIACEGHSLVLRCSNASIAVHTEQQQQPKEENSPSRQEQHLEKSAEEALFANCLKLRLFFNSESATSSPGAQGSTRQTLQSSRKTWHRPDAGDGEAALGCISWVMVSAVTHPAGATASPRANTVSWTPSCPTSQFLLAPSYDKERCSWASL